MIGIGNYISITHTGSVTAAPVSVTAPVASGVTYVGQTLSVTDGIWNGAPTSFTYQWKRNGSSIGSATASSYVVTLADEAQSITCAVTATNAIGSTSATSNTLRHWTPADLTTAPVAWYDALSPSTLTLSGSNVSAWADRSGNGRTMTQGTAANQPLYSAGKVSFAGNSGATSNPNLSYMTWTGTSHRAINFTVTASLLLANGGSDQSQAGCVSVAGTNPDWYMGLYQSGSTFTRISQILTTGTPTSQKNNPFPIDTKSYYQGRGRSTTQNSYINTNGTVQDFGTSAYDGVLLSTYLCLGVQKIGFNNRTFKGDLNEVVLTAANESAAEADKLRGYIAHRHGLTTQLAAADPYKTNAPTL